MGVGFEWSSVETIHVGLEVQSYIVGYPSPSLNATDKRHLHRAWPASGGLFSARAHPKPQNALN